MFILLTAELNRMLMDLTIFLSNSVCVSLSFSIRFRDYVRIIFRFEIRIMIRIRRHFLEAKDRIRERSILFCE